MDAVRSGGAVEDIGGLMVYASTAQPLRTCKEVFAVKKYNVIDF